VHVPTIVCPVDYSDCSKRALRFAGALADHFHARLLVLHVFDPLLGATAGLHGFDLTGSDGQRELDYFTADHLPETVREGTQLERLLALGSPGREIIRAVRARDADLLVMGTHGFSGARRAVFGSTLQGVLRRVKVPVLAVPLVDHREAGIHAPLVASGPVLAPVDFSPESEAAAHAAAGLARALELPLLLLHATAPDGETTGDGTARTEDAAAKMARLCQKLGTIAPLESRIVEGEPSALIAKLARERRSALVVMSLGSAAMRRRRRKPGSIAYRVLCLAPVPVLALPETPSGRLYIQYIGHGAAVATTA
jgi:universal stress protein A